MNRIGFGYDIHKLVIGRPLILGGVHIDFEKGLLGHSDADVLVHAIMDALLGALAMGDIGQHFPDTDPEYKNADSMLLLKHVGNLIYNEGYKIVNIDSTVVCEKPKLKDYIPKMSVEISKVLNIAPDCVSVKATTNEKMGSVGEGNAICSMAVVMLEKVRKE